MCSLLDEDHGEAQRDQAYARDELQPGQLPEEGVCVYVMDMMFVMT